MIIFTILSVSILYSLAMIMIKPKWAGYFGAMAAAGLILPLYLGHTSTASPVLSIPILFEVSYGFHNYTFIGAIAFALLGSIVLLYNAPRMNRWQLCAIGLAIASTLGITLAKSFMSFFLYWELLTATTALIIFTDKNSDSRHQLGTTFLVTHLVAGLFLLFGILLHFNVTGSLDLTTPAAGIGFIIFWNWYEGRLSTSTFLASIYLSKSQSRGNYCIINFHNKSWNIRLGSIGS